ncbi:MAG: phenylacetate--CoA ligase [Firmicutes bacterium]|nr:phenylacetate--CoA ligase [Bacillota bacterium]
MFFQKDIETMSRREIEELQLKKLKYMVDYCYNNVPMYHEKLGKAGITGDKIKTLSDIQYIPFTTKDDMRDNYPFGLLAVPMKQIIRIQASSGTTGKMTVGAYTRKDIDIWSDLVARVAVAAGVTDEDIVQIAFGYGLFTGALGLHYGLEKVGATVIPASSGNTQKQLMMFRDFGVTGLVATPSYAIYLGEAVRESGYPMSDYKLRLGLLGSEGCTPEMRTQIEKNLNIFVTDNYGLTELGGPGVSGDCELRCGMHLAEDHFLPEIIDKDTGEVLDKGETGELVVTTLSREGMPVLRYRTKDITRLNYEPCACGRTHVRMDKVTGRTDDMIIVKGVNVFPSQVESVLVGMEHIGPHYQLVVRRGAHQLDTLEVKVELTNGELLERYSELEALQKNIHDRLKSVLGLETKVTLVEPKTLERFQGKAKRVLDLRNVKE